MSAHTKLPWYWTEHGVRPEDGPTSFRITGPELETLAHTNGYSELDEANAKFIVLACNSFDELLAACEEAHAVLFADSEPDQWSRGTQRTLQAAIAKAKL